MRITGLRGEYLSHQVSFDLENKTERIILALLSLSEGKGSRVQFHFSDNNKRNSIPKKAPSRSG